MLNLSQPVTGITHPLVEEIYLKKDFGYGHRGEDVLVIEARCHGADDNSNNNKSFDSYLTDLLSDLNDIQMQAEQEFGTFDRVDIRTH